MPVQREGPLTRSPNWGRVIVRSARMTRVAVGVSHPVQHFCPQYAFLAEQEGLTLKVLFGVRGGAAGYFDAEFQRHIQFREVLRLDDFDHEFMSSSHDLAHEDGVTRAQVWDALDDFQPDVVVVYGTRRPTSRWVWLWAKARRRRVAYVSDSEDRGAERSASQKILSRTLAPAVFRTVDRFFTVGDSNEEFYLRRWVPPSHLTRVPFPVDRLTMDSLIRQRDPRRKEMRKKCRIGDQETFVINVGKLVSFKRQEDLIEAASRQARPPVVGLLGSGPEAERLRLLGETLGVRCIMPGFVSPVDLPKWYVAADLYVHPSLRDHHSLSISEAVYAGLPVIASDRTGSFGPTDDVQPERNGFVSRAGDAASLGAHLGRLMGDPELLRRFGSRSTEIGRQNQQLAHEGLASELGSMAIRV